MESLDLALVNTFFNKKEENLITYKSGGNSSQIDFIMTLRADLKEMRDCKVIPGEEVVSQHRLLCAVLKIKEAKHRRRTREKRIKVWTVKGEKVTEYRDKVEEEYQRRQTLMQKKVGNYLRKSSRGQQKRYVEPPKEGNTWRVRPGGAEEHEK